MLHIYMCVYIHIHTHTHTHTYKTPQHNTDTFTALTINTAEDCCIFTVKHPDD